MATVTSPAAADGNGAQAKSETEVQAILKQLGVQPIVNATKVATISKKHHIKNRHYSSKLLLRTQTASYYSIKQDAF